MKSEILYLGHIRDAIDKIKTYMGILVYEEFVSNEMAVDAVVRQLEIIGESANKLCNEFREDHPEIPFRDIIDMRNVLIHDYVVVNTQIVLETCQHDLPRSRTVVEAALQDG